MGPKITLDMSGEIRLNGKMVAIIAGVVVVTGTVVVVASGGSFGILGANLVAGYKLVKGFMSAEQSLLPGS